ncbi:MAG: NAD-dependent epimerase/dehydratase family protein [Acetobacteraceae bacterium]
MPPQRILITGAAGFAGRHLLVLAAQRFPEVRLLATGEHEQPGIRRLDVTNMAAARAVIADFRPDAVVHLAAVAAVAEANRAGLRTWHVNLGGTCRLARAVLEAAPGAAFLFASSAAVYGRSFLPGAPLSEAAPLAPFDTYGATKAAAEMALSAMVSEGLRLIRLRPFNHIGPGQSGAFAIGAFAAQIARIEAGKQPPVLAAGSLEACRDFLDVRDVCAGYLAALERADTLESGIAINLASGTARRLSSVLDELLALARVPIAVETDPLRLRRTDLPISVGDATRAARLLGWRPAIPWPKTLADLLADCRMRTGLEATS